MQTTPIEIIESILNAQQVRDDIQVEEVLVPEQCALVSIDGRLYHVTLQEVEA